MRPESVLGNFIPNPPTSGQFLKKEDRKKCLDRICFNWKETFKNVNALESKRKKMKLSKQQKEPTMLSKKKNKEKMAFFENEKNSVLFVVFGKFKFFSKTVEIQTKKVQ